jgi:hypothetical protein
MRNLRGEKTQGFVSMDGDDPEYGAPTRPITVDGITYLPATDCTFASPEDNRGRRHGMLLVSLGRAGLNVAMSPASLRTFASHMNKVAGEIEAAAKAQTDAALARAAGRNRA